MSSHHLKQKQNVQYIPHCSQSPTSSEYDNDHLVTTHERIKIITLKRKFVAITKNI